MPIVKCFFDERTFPKKGSPLREMSEGQRGENSY